MIEVHKDALGNISGYFDTERKQWVPPPPTDMEAEVLDEVEEQAADSDDAGEPEPIDYTDWTKDQLKKHLDEAGVDYPRSANRDQLIALMQAEAT